MACISGASVAIAQFQSTDRNFDQQAARSSLGSERDRKRRSHPRPWRDLPARLRGLRSGLHLAAVDKVDLGTEDNHVAFLYAIAYFQLRPQIPCHGYFSD